MRRFAIVAATAVLSIVGPSALAGCGIRDSTQDAVQAAADVGAEGQALVAMGFDPLDVQAAAPGGAPSAGPGQDTGDDRVKRDGGRHRHRVNMLLRKNTLHGEVVVQTKKGAKTIAVQRGVVTAIDGDSVTVKSTDGFAMTWTFGDKLRVVEHRSAVQPDQVAVGTQVGVAGLKDGDGGLARLIVIPRHK